MQEQAEHHLIQVRKSYTLKSSKATKPGLSFLICILRQKSGTEL